MSFDYLDESTVEWLTSKSAALLVYSGTGIWKAALESFSEAFEEGILDRNHPISARLYKSFEHGPPRDEELEECFEHLIVERLLDRDYLERAVAKFDTFSPEDIGLVREFIEDERRLDQQG